MGLPSDTDPFPLPSLDILKPSLPGSSSSFSGRETYFIRLRNSSQVSGASGGLGFDQIKETGPIKVGHKSTLKLSQEKASRDINQGNQRVLPEVLREGTTPRSVPPRRLCLST